MMDSQAILLASAIASTTATFVSNPFEVLKIRQQTSGFNCRLHNTRQQQNSTQRIFKYVENKVEYGPYSQARVMHQVLQTPRYNQVRSFLSVVRGYLPPSEPYNQLMRYNVKKLSCACLQSDSLTQSIKQIYKNEGPRTFFNGWRYAVIQAAVSTMCYFTFYENSKRIFSKYSRTNDRVTLPLLSSFISRFLTTSITFPLEYWRVLQSSVSGQATQKILGTKFTSAFAVTVQRDVIFSCVYWSILENCKQELKKSRLPIDLVNLMSGVIAGVTTATITLPLDVVKTRKQVSTRLDIVLRNGGGSNETSTLKLLKEIIDQEGMTGLFKGFRPRMMKVTVSGGLVYMLYERIKDILLSK